MSSHRCDENCLSCEGSSRNCSRCKAGFTQLGTSCITNHTCSNGEHQQGALRAAHKAVKEGEKEQAWLPRVGVLISDLFDHLVDYVS